MANTKKYVSLDKLSLYDEKIKKVISDGDAASLQASKDYADSLAGNYDAAGAAATVQGELDKEVIRAKAREDEIAGLVSTAQGEVDALEGVVATKAAQADLEALSGKVGTVPADQTVMGIIANIQENAYDDTEIRGLISNLDTNKADKTQVATDIENAVKAEKEAREAAVSGVQGAVDTLSGTHATDKAELEGKIAQKADQTALEAVSAVANAAVKQADYDVKVKALEDEDARIAGLVEAEVARAEAAEKGLGDRLVEVEAFFKTAEGEKLDEALDTLVELQGYLEGEGAVADQMILDIAANKKAIEDHVAIDHDFASADAALKSELEGKINLKANATDVEAIDGRVDTLEGEMDVVEGKVEVLEGEMDDVQAAVATKVEQEAYNAKVEALEAKDTELAGKIEVLEGKFTGEGSVEDMIGDAKDAAIEAAAADATSKANAAEAAAKEHANGLNTAMDARVAAVEAASATHALASDLEALDGRVEVVEGKVSTLEGKMTAVETKAGANETAIGTINTELAKKAAQSDLEGVDGRVTAIETWHANFVEVSEEEINGLFA